jgi:hypothetical protein
MSCGLKAFSKFLYLPSLLLVCFTLSAAAIPCKLGYQGVLGIGDRAIGLIKSETTKKIYFVQANTTIDECQVRVKSVGRNAITIESNRQLVVLSSQGSGQRFTKSESASQLQPTGNEHIDALIEAGQQAVDAGEMTREELEEVVAEEKSNLEELKVKGAELREKKLPSDAPPFIGQSISDF